MTLPHERILKAGILIGYLTREENKWLNMLGDTDVTKIVVRKSMMEKLERECPGMIEEFNETLRLMSAKRKPKKKRRR
jgi:hypothetical protein